MLPDEERHPTSIAALGQDFLVRIADVLEARLPVFLRIDRQRMWFARNSIDFASRFTYRVNDTFVPVAAQLAATRGSPKAPVEDKNDKGVIPNDPVQPTLSRTDRRIE